jgi:O-antigen ligase
MSIQIRRGLTVAVFLALIFSTGISNFYSLAPLVALIAVILFLISFIKTDFALVLLIFSMLLSPEFKLGAVTGREVVVRFDDLFLVVIFLGWLAKMAIEKELGLFKHTPINRPILAYLLIGIIATLLGALRGYLKLHVSMFYFLKYVEYYLLFIMLVNNLKNIRQVKMLIFSLFTVALLVSIYACILHFQGVERTTAPFEGSLGEANTLGGYLIIMIMLATGLFLNLPSTRNKIFLLGFLFFALPAFIFTLSRGSWFSFIPAVFTLILLTRKGKLILLVSALIVLVFAPLIFPRYFYERIHSTFGPGREYEIGGKRVTLEDSASARIENLKYALKRLGKEPFLGYGIGSAQPIIDNQYARVITEVGILGFLAFGWIIVSIFTNARRNFYRLASDGFAGGLIVGFMAGLVGLLVHSLSAETFILIRVMEPFWFLAAIVIMLPNILAGGQEKTT